MRYRTRLIMLGIITLALAFAATAAALKQRVPARVTRVIDGDTFKVEARVWPGITAQSSVRVREHRTKNRKPRPEAFRAESVSQIIELPIASVEGIIGRTNISGPSLARTT